jgi:hypothetical protein
VNFTYDNTDANLISDYKDSLITKLSQLLNSTDTTVKQEAITAIASCVTTLHDDMEEHYNQSVPKLKEILADETTTGSLRDKVIEALSMIGMTVGHKMFHKDAVEIMELISDSIGMLFCFYK